MIESGATNNVVTNFVQKKYKILLSTKLIHTLRTDRIEEMIQDCTVKSLIDRLMKMFEKVNDVSYVYIKHNVRNGFVTYHGSNYHRNTFDVETENDAEEWRKNLCIGDSEDVLVAFAWSHDVEKRKMLLFPEFLAIDMTFGLNKERRNLLTFVGVDGHNRTFTGCRCWMPSKQTVAYRWAIDVALPLLIGKKGMWY